MAVTQMQLVNPVADRAGLSRSHSRRALMALDEVVLDELGNAQKVRIGGLVQLTVRVRSACKARTGCNPATGEQITIIAGSLPEPNGLTSTREIHHGCQSHKTCQ